MEELKPNSDSSVFVQGDDNCSCKASWMYKVFCAKSMENKQSPAKITWIKRLIPSRKCAIFLTGFFAGVILTLATIFALAYSGTYTEIWELYLLVVVLFFAFGVSCFFLPKGEF